MINCSIRKKIAFIGASASPKKWVYIIFFNILKGNFNGTVYPVNPTRESILGVKCYPSVADIPEPADLAIITTPAPLVRGLIKECGEKGIPNVIVVSSDFSETGPEGARLEREVVAAARAHGIRIVGPNTMGVFSAGTDLHALMVPVMPSHGAVSMFSQSGNLSAHMLLWGLEEGVGFEKFVGSGNERDLTCVDYLRYFDQDKATQVIMAYLEGLEPDTDMYLVDKEVSRKKPVIFFRGGRTSAGGKAAASHSGAMAVSNRLSMAAFH
ncbi:MAG: CoA-binding protein [Deltaproteobacteria bacterium]|nr:CoA-binding protein [Deltaproteobacteria bacterium]MBW2051258.1 CoA-binding protein [Deltaproteobacteria bacterium]MBW2140326.1 CoA-binding protein [Deltaproteobacteria bacterium]MBW2323561.1 CoA-binding protein [Deltaproteobacteria bacterium]